MFALSGYLTRARVVRPVDTKTRTKADGRGHIAVVAALALTRMVSAFLPRWDDHPTPADLRNAL